VAKNLIQLIEVEESHLIFYGLTVLLKKFFTSTLHTLLRSLTAVDISDV